MSNTVFQSRAFLTLQGWFRVLILAVAAFMMTAGAMAEEGEHAEHHGLTPDAPLIDLGPIKVTNSMIFTWVVGICIIVFAQYATRKIKDVPDGAQNFWEWLVESLHNFLESIIG